MSECDFVKEYFRNAKMLYIASLNGLAVLRERADFSSQKWRIQLLIIATSGPAIKVQARRSGELSPTEFLASPRPAVLEWRDNNDLRCNNYLSCRSSCRARILTSSMKDRPSLDPFSHLFFFPPNCIISSVQLCEKIIIYANVAFIWQF